MSENSDLNFLIDLYFEGDYDRVKAISDALSKLIPDDPQLLYIRGLLAFRRKQPDQAIDFFQAALKNQPDNPQYLESLARLLLDQKYFDEAKILFEKLTVLKPKDIGTIASIGRCCAGAGFWQDASTQFKKALEFDPSNGSYLHQLTRSLSNNGQIQEAVALCENSLSRGDPGEFLVSQISSILPIIPASSQEMNFSRNAYERLIKLLPTHKYPLDEEILISTSPQFLAAYQARNNKATQKTIATYYKNNCPSLNFVANHVDKYSWNGKKIKIGFISNNLRNHSIGKLNMGIIDHLDKTLFEVIIVSTYEPFDEISQNIKYNSDKYLLLPHSLTESRELISNEKLDVIFYPDIGMDVFTYFLAFSRLAPIQCVGWGHPMTTGIETIDYFVTSQDLESNEPKVYKSHYTEKVVILKQPLTYNLPIAYEEEEQRKTSNPIFNFRKGKTYYLCVQALFKIHPEFDGLIANILRKDTLGFILFIEGQPGWSQQILRRFRKFYPDVVNRIIFLERMNQTSFFSLVRKADVLIDSIHFSGGVSSYECLSLGKAIVTWPNSELQSGRVTYSYYRQMAVLDCIADNLTEFVDIAVRLGKDISFRRKIEYKIQQNCHKIVRSPVPIKEFTNFLTKQLNLIQTV
ncbi:MAG: tetratricopeptide repeat protein [Pseudomonadota bacterium]|nr:tetratricopeptide repeat protein [Pseudomonadota bacterium]